RILVIDDNVSIHEDIRKILGVRKEVNGMMADAKAMLFDEKSKEAERIDFEIDSALQGEEGLNKVRQKAESGCPYAVAFVDVRMPPGRDGVETNHPDLERISRIAGRPLHRLHRLFLGRDDRAIGPLRKPCDPEKAFRQYRNPAIGLRIDPQMGVELSTQETAKRFGHSGDGTHHGIAKRPR
ncbi:MAG: hypothetical protein ABIQ35_06725, partial [Verrucomicrobiota bacterium]